MATDERKPLGRILIKQKLVSEAQLDSALREQQAPGAPPRPLASRLTEAGVIGEVDALRALSEQHGVPGIDLSQIAVLLEHLECVPGEMCESHQILPVLVRDDRIFLAMANPKDKRVIDELEFVTGKKVYPYIALTTTLARTITAAYDARARGEAYFLGPHVPPETLKQLGLTAPQAAAPPAAAQTTRPAAHAAPQQAAPPAAPRPSPHAAAAPVEPAMTIRAPPPNTPQGIVDEALRRSGEEAKLQTGDFGNLAEEVSSVMALPPELRAQLPVAGPGVTPNSKLIMIVDDQEDIRKLVKRVFVEKGHRVIEADRGLLALRLVKEHVPDLLILDAMLPELHGFDIAKRLKGSEKYGAIPIIMISAAYRGWRIAEDLKHSYGIDEYIEKPFRIGDLMAAATRVLEKQPGEEPKPVSDTLSAEAEKALADGIAAYQAGNIDHAIELLAHGTTIDPLAYRLHFHLALLYGKKGQIYDGISELEKAIELNPRHYPALKNLAVLYEKAGFKLRAIEMWERCAHVAPDAATREQIKGHLIGLF